VVGQVETERVKQYMAEMSCIFIKKYLMCSIQYVMIEDPD